MVLLSIIERTVKEFEGSIVPHDMAIDELKAMANEQELEADDLTIVMAAYMLGFGTYKGFAK